MDWLGCGRGAGRRGHGWVGWVGGGWQPPAAFPAPPQPPSMATTGHCSMPLAPWSTPFKGRGASGRQAAAAGGPTACWMPLTSTGGRARALPPRIRLAAVCRRGPCLAAWAAWRPYSTVHSVPTNAQVRSGTACSRPTLWVPRPCGPLRRLEAAGACGQIPGTAPTRLRLANCPAAEPARLGRTAASHPSSTRRGSPSRPRIASLQHLGPSPAIDHRATAAVGGRPRSGATPAAGRKSVLAAAPSRQPRKVPAAP